MLRCRRHRLTAIFLMACSLLFSQLALAGYVCPQQGGAAAMAERMAAGEPCDGMDDAQPGLCHQHAAAGAQSFEAVKLPAAALPAVVQVLVLPLVADAGVITTLPHTATAEAQAPPDPVFLATRRLRV